jgi:hypothetical protein
MDVWRHHDITRSNSGIRTGVQPHILKISVAKSSTRNEVLRLEGHLGGPWVDELCHSCRCVLAVGKRLTLDLAGVSFVSREGVKLLKKLQEDEVQVANCSPFVALQLQEDSEL